MATLMGEFQHYMISLKDMVDVVLVQDVAPVIVDRIENMAEVNVYAAYEPTQYIRRLTLNKDNAYDRSASGMELTIDCTVTGNPMYAPPVSEGWDPGEIADIITSGVGYHWHNSKIYNDTQPRPWMEPGLQDAINDKSAERALEQGLVAYGF